MLFLFYNIYILGLMVDKKMPMDIKPVLDAIVKVFDALNRMNRGEIFETLAILKDDNLDLALKIKALKDNNLSFGDNLDKIQEGLDDDIKDLFKESLKIQMAAILYSEEDKKAAIERWEEHLFSKSMTVYRLSENEFEKLNPSSDTRIDNRFKSVTSTTGDLLKDLERLWMGMSSKHVCVLVDGKKLYRLNSMVNLFEATFIPLDIAKPNLEQLAGLLPENNQSLSLTPEQIKLNIGHAALSKSFSSERFEWEYKKKEGAIWYSLLFNFDSYIKSQVRPLDVLGVICDDILVYINNIHSDKNKIANLAAFILTLALIALATTAIVSLFITTPAGWATFGAIMAASTIVTLTAVVSRTINFLGWYLTHEPADNPNRDEFLTAKSRFRLTKAEEQTYLDKGYDAEQIKVVKEALVALAIDMKLFSESGKKRHHSLFKDKISQNTLIKDLKSCHLEAREYKVTTESRWKHGGIDRAFVIGKPVNPPEPDVTKENNKP